MDGWGGVEVGVDDRERDGFFDEEDSEIGMDFVVWLELEEEEEGPGEGCSGSGFKEMILMKVAAKGCSAPNNMMASFFSWVVTGVL